MPYTAVFRAWYLFGFLFCARTRRMMFPIASRAVGSGFLQGVYSSIILTSQTLLSSIRRPKSVI